MSAAGNRMVGLTWHSTQRPQPGNPLWMLMEVGTAVTGALIVLVYISAHVLTGMIHTAGGCIGTEKLTRAVWRNAPLPPGHEVPCHKGAHPAHRSYPALPMALASLTHANPKTCFQPTRSMQHNLAWLPITVDREVFGSLWRPGPTAGPPRTPVPPYQALYTPQLQATCSAAPRAWRLCGAMSHCSQIT